MTIHLQREIEKLKKDLLLICSIVEEQVEMAIRALLDRDTVLAQKVVSGDADVDRREIEVEEECLKTLALHQPVANDLRMLIAALKINNDLERIGDLAVNIAREAEAFVAEPPVDVPIDVGGMWEKTQKMLRDSVDALVNLDVALAADVCRRDDEIDAMKHDMRIVIEAAIRSTPDRITALLKLMAVCRNLERIADRATNIAEDVIYMVEGKIVRHHKD
jgi:phosphate transport system protein